MKFLRWFFAIFGIGVGAFLLLLWFINTPYVYESARKEVANYTHIALSNDTSIDRYCVRNFFLLDGPDFYFELTLSNDDKARLIKFFEENQKGTSFSSTAVELVPASWKPRNRKLEHYYVSATAPDVQICLDVDADSGKAWLVVWTL